MTALRQRLANLLFRLATRLAGKRHIYLSTACLHELIDGDLSLHGACRATCKTCCEPCICGKHPAYDNHYFPPPWVDQARNVAVRFLAVIREHGIDLADAEPDLHEALLYDPNLFWLRGEVQPAGEWHPTHNNEETPNA